MDLTAEDMSDKIGRILVLRNEMLVTAESCTGGGLAELLTRIAGSSQWFERGYVTYSNTAKRELLGVRTDTLEQSGAVSEATALEMAWGAISHSQAQNVAAITGIAGPGGGTDDKPIGMVCFAWVCGSNNNSPGPSQSKHDPRRFTHAHTNTAQFTGNRQQVRQQACMLALQGLLDLLGG